MPFIPVTNLPPVPFIPVANLPPVPLIPVANLPPVPLIPVANFLLVSLTQVMRLDLRIFPRIFEKIQNDPIVIFKGLGEDDS